MGYLDGDNGCHVRCLALKDPSDPDSGPGEWLDLIHAVNAFDPGVFTRAESEPWWAGGHVEEYHHARVIHRGDDSVSVVAKTPYGTELLRRAADTLNLQWSP